MHLVRVLPRAVDKPVALYFMEQETTDFVLFEIES